jgi:membrane protease YdiL (CAAX protease family)
MLISRQLVECSKTKARRGLAVFFAALLLSSALLGHYIGGLTEVFGSHFMSVYLWSVAGASVAARLLLRESPRDISFRWYGWMTSRAMLVGTALPLAVGLIAYGIGWSMGLAHFAAPQIPQAVFGFSISGSPAQRFCEYLLVSLTLGGLWSCRLSAGEEIGWRGYMLTRLMDSGLQAPIWMSGVIWGLWHIPLILDGKYTAVPNSILSISVFVIDITALGYVFAWLRLSSGSIWPCVWAHGLWNQVFLGPFGGSPDGSGIWVGEAGVLTTLVVILLAVALYRFLPLQPRAPGRMSGQKL